MLLPLVVSCVSCTRVMLGDEARRLGAGAPLGQPKDLAPEKIAGRACIIDLNICAVQTEGRSELQRMPARYALCREMGPARVTHRRDGDTRVPQMTHQPASRCLM